MTLAADVHMAPAAAVPKPLKLPAAAVGQRGSIHACPAPGTLDMSRLLATLDESARMAAWVREYFSNGSSSPAAAAAAARLEHSVWFNSPLNSAVDVTPYSQIYGVHPRFFNFDENGEKQFSVVADPWRTAASSPAAGSPQASFGFSPCASPSAPFGLGFSPVPVAAGIASFCMPPASPSASPLSACGVMLRSCGGGVAPPNHGATLTGPCRTARGTPHASTGARGLGFGMSEPAPAFATSVNTGCAFQRSSSWGALGNGARAPSSPATPCGQGGMVHIYPQRV